ncbi:uncharacterized protein LOC144708208 isoform X1 [Wolffia australiana]
MSTLPSRVGPGEVRSWTRRPGSDRSRTWTSRSPEEPPPIQSREISTVHTIFMRKKSRVSSRVGRVKELIQLKREARLKGGFYVEPEAKLLFIIRIWGFFVIRGVAIVGSRANSRPVCCRVEFDVLGTQPRDEVAAEDDGSSAFCGSFLSLLTLVTSTLSDLNTNFDRSSNFWLFYLFHKSKCLAHKPKFKCLAHKPKFRCLAKFNQNSSKR